MTTFRRWVIMVCLCLSAAAIYLLPYSTEVYYKPLQASLGVSNTQLGWLLSTLGIVNMLGYFPGGWLADRFTPRTLLACSLLATGGIGLYFSTFPSYGMCILVYAGWSLSTIFAFWAALIKATRNWGGDDEQGRAFGILEGGRGVIRFGLSALGVMVLGWFANQVAGFATVVRLYSFLNIGLGVVVWFLLREPAAEASATPEAPPLEPGDDEPAAQAKVEAVDDEPAAQPKLGARAVVQVLKLPAVWLIGIVIFSAYTMYLGSYYFTPYATDAFGLSVVMAGYLGAGKMMVRPISAGGAGFLGDRKGSSRVVAITFVIGLFSFGLFALAPSYSYLLQSKDVPNAARLVHTLDAGKDPVSTFLVHSFTKEQRKMLDAASHGPVTDAQKAKLVGAIDQVLRKKELYKPARFAGIALRPVTKKYLPKAGAKKRTDSERIRSNRLLLEDALPGVITRLPKRQAEGGAPVFMILFLVFNVGLATLCVYALRGLYYALLQEGGVPVELTGTATGIVSILGYTPDIFFPPLVGYFLDHHPGGAGYRHSYAAVCVICLVGFAASVVFLRRYGRPRAAPANAAPDADELAEEAAPPSLAS